MEVDWDVIDLNLADTSTTVKPDNDFYVTKANLNISRDSHLKTQVPDFIDETFTVNTKYLIVKPNTS